MKTTRFPIKIVLLSIGILLLWLIIICVVIYQFRVQLAEYLYKEEPTSENLIQLSIWLVDSNDYDKMMKYLPRAVELDDFIEVSESKELFIVHDENKRFAAEDTYYTIIMESALSYVYAENYEGFHKEFRKIYPKIIAERNYNMWYEVMRKKDRITKEGYENIIKAIDENAPPLVERIPENRGIIREYVQCIMLKALVFEGMGDMETGDKLREEFFQLLRELKSATEK